MNSLQLLARRVIENPGHQGWTLQGHGKLQTFLNPDVSLHIWHSELKAPNASMIHTHPWGFESVVLWGAMENIQYYEVIATDPTSYTHKWAQVSLDKNVLEPGEYLTRLVQDRDHSKCYHTGESYTVWDHSVIHETSYKDGTVTIIRRNRLQPSNRIARVFWPKDEEWGSCAPRPATPEEIDFMTYHAVSLFKEVFK